MSVISDSLFVKQGRMRVRLGQLKQISDCVKHVMNNDHSVSIRRREGIIFPCGSPEWMTIQNWYDARSTNCGQWTGPNTPN